MGMENDRSKGDFLWTLFLETGMIDAYLSYKQMADMRLEYEPSKKERGLEHI